MMVTVGARNSLDSVPIWPYLGICTARTVVTDVPVLLLNQPNAWSLSLTELLHGFKTGVICVIEKNTLILITPSHFIKIFLECVRAFQTGRRTRKRRYFPDLVEYTCDGGISHPSHSVDFASCFAEGKIWQVRCRVTTRTCYKIVVCPSFDDCYQRHLTNTVFCCEYVFDTHPNAAAVEEF